MDEIFVEYFKGMIGLDKKISWIDARKSRKDSVIPFKNSIANSIVAKVVSPYFTANDFQFAYARA